MGLMGVGCHTSETIAGLGRLQSMPLFLLGFFMFVTLKRCNKVKTSRARGRGRNGVFHRFIVTSIDIALFFYGFSMKRVKRSRRGGVALLAPPGEKPIKYRDLLGG